MSTSRQLQLVLVTPEQTLLDEPVTAVRLPLFDGLAGLRPGRAPMVGRLGTGELRFDAVGGGTRSYYVDGGFVQVKGTVVSVLTNRAVPSNEIDRAEADKLLDEARSMPAATDEAYDEKKRAEDRARQLQAIAARS